MCVANVVTHASFAWFVADPMLLVRGTLQVSLTGSAYIRAVGGAHHALALLSLIPVCLLHAFGWSWTGTVSQTVQANFS